MCNKMKTMENETTKAVWQKPEIIALDLELTEKNPKTSEGTNFAPSVS